MQLEIKNKILNHIEGNPRTVHQICADTDLSYSTVSNYLHILDCKGLVNKIKSQGKRLVWIKKELEVVGGV